jgi:HEPN domain-containing protein
MRFNPNSEVKYRVTLAKRYLDEATRAYEGRDYRLTVASSQLSAENSAKSIVAVFRIPSCSHDPSYELMELLNNLPEELKNQAMRLADLAHNLAPEHGRSTYGEPARGLTPWDIYAKDEASKSLNYAEEAFAIAKLLIKKLGMKIDQAL